MTVLSATLTPLSTYFTGKPKCSHTGEMLEASQVPPAPHVHHYHLPTQLLAVHSAASNFFFFFSRKINPRLTWPAADWGVIQADHRSPMIRYSRSFDGGETGASRGNTHEHEENMQTPHNKSLLQLGIKPRTFLLWDPVLTTNPPCRVYKSHNIMGVLKCPHQYVVSKWMRCFKQPAKLLLSVNSRGRCFPDSLPSVSHVQVDLSLL